MAQLIGSGFKKVIILNYALTEFESSLVVENGLG
jgi:hypothetical protein